MLILISLQFLVIELIVNMCSKNPKPWYFRYDKKKDPKDNLKKRYKLSMGIAHPDYGPDSPSGDIGILFLEENDQNLPEYLPIHGGSDSSECVLGLIKRQKIDMYGGGMHSDKKDYHACLNRNREC